jgi:manganese/zinc/iron transport system permease protein
MNSTTVIIITGILVSTACSLLGCFLVLRRMAMMSDAISHAILPGIVVGYFVAQGPNLLWGFLGAAIAAIITVTFVEMLQNTGRVGSESAIGIVFPAMFAFGTFLVSKYFANVHIDTDAVLYGNIEFSSFDTFFVGNTNVGPQSFWVMGALCLLNLAFITLFYKELKLGTFDAGLAATLGFAPILLHYGLMATVSVTAVGAFTAVGAVLVVAFMIIPAATAYLLTDRLPVMIGLSVGIGVLSSIGGYLIAATTDASIAGSMAFVAGMLFGMALLFSPLHGVIARARHQQYQRVEFATETLAVHLYQHEAIAGEEHESEVAHLNKELRWPGEFANKVIHRAVDRQLVQRTNGHLALTNLGRQLAAQQMMEE